MAMFFDTKYEPRPYTGISKQVDMGSIKNRIDVQQYDPKDFEGTGIGAIGKLLSGYAESKKARDKEKFEKELREEEAKIKQAERDQRAEEKKEDRRRKDVELYGDDDPVMEARRLKKLKDDADAKRAPKTGGGKGGGKSGGGSNEKRFSPEYIKITENDSENSDNERLREILPPEYSIADMPGTGVAEKVLQKRLADEKGATQQNVAPSDEENVKRALKNKDVAGAWAYMAKNYEDANVRRVAQAYLKSRAGDPITEEEKKLLYRAGDLREKRVPKTRQGPEHTNDLDIAAALKLASGMDQPPGGTGKAGGRTPEEQELDLEMKRLRLEEARLKASGADKIDDQIKDLMEDIKDDEYYINDNEGWWESPSVKSRRSELEDKKKRLAELEANRASQSAPRNVPAPSPETTAPPAAQRPSGSLTPEDLADIKAKRAEAEAAGDVKMVEDIDRRLKMLGY